jgi:hypothetical protein
MQATSTLSGMMGLYLVMAMACSGEDKADTSSPPDISVDSGGSGTDTCEGTAPVVDDLWCVNSGVKPHFETGEDTVTMQLWTSASDVDGDLTSYALQIYYDDEVDESVDTSVVNFSPVYGTVGADECTAADAELGLTLYLTGDDPAFDTLYDWGVVVTDAAGIDSEIAVISCWTPASDGTDGGVE